MFLSAHGTVAASIRGLTEVAGPVTVRKQTRLVELGLRPPFFVTGDASRRLATLVHELLHLDPARPGQLLDERRHKNRPHADHEAQARAITKMLLHNVSPRLIAPLAHHGPALMAQWLVRPVTGTDQRPFSDRDLGEIAIEVRTPKARRSTWW